MDEGMEPLRLVSLTRTCSACPSQWDALTDDKRKVYICYRWGYLSVRVGEQGDMEEFAGVYGAEWFGQEYGGEYDGVMGEETLKSLTSGLVEYPSLAIR